MKKANKVFIATSLDGYIADNDGGIDWLHSVPNPDGLDLGYLSFMTDIDAIVMGRNTFETVCGFDIEWPYKVPVFVLSNSMKEVAPKYRLYAQIVTGSLRTVVNEIHQMGYYQLYIDGGSTITGFLKADMIDEMTITTIPILLGTGIPLFSNIDQRLKFKCIYTDILLDTMVQSTFIRDQY